MSDSIAEILSKNVEEHSSGKIKTCHRWFSEARLGMFVHYGLYSLFGRDEWIMLNESIPKEIYNCQADEFRAEKFDAEEIVNLAKEAGAGYVVMGARHHEAFCLWDTKTTDFNTVKTAAKRDLIREFTDACRRAGLKVGLYYSVMNWQWPAQSSGPESDPEGWEAMVREMHEQVRELMTNYGQIDLLWYDAALVPGISSDAEIARLWRSREMNAMVRRLQPAILINDRSGPPEDYSTPEQHLTVPPKGRLWEMCMTLGNHWGWQREADPPKPVKQLIGRLVECARHGGNLLLNIGPCPDGSLQPAQVARMKAVGRWMKTNAAAVRGTKRTPYTEAAHLLGSATCRGNRLYFHVMEWPGTTARIAGAASPILTARLLATGQELTVSQRADGVALLGGLPARSPDSAGAVIEIEFAGRAPTRAPVALLRENDTGLHAPAEAALQLIRRPAARPEHVLEVPVPVAGRYVLELEAIASRAFRLEAELGGRKIPGTLGLPCGDYPGALRSRAFTLAEGSHRLTLRSAIPFRIESWRLQPVWQPLSSECWSTIGPFPSKYHIPGGPADVLAAMETVFPPETEYHPGIPYPGTDEVPVRWKREAAGFRRLDFTHSLSGDRNGVFYARTEVFSPESQIVEVLLSTDWWANLALNGEWLTGTRDPQACACDGARFVGWKPQPARAALRKGINVFLVKNHRGRGGNYFSFFLNNPGNLRISAGGEDAGKVPASSEESLLMTIS